MTDLQIRIFAPQLDVQPAQASTYRVEARLSDGACFAGEATFEMQAHQQAKSDSMAYGRLLHHALLASPAIQRAYLKAEALSPVRLRLVTDPPEIAALLWERLLLDTDGEDRPAAASPHTPFSRFYEREEPATPTTDVPTILLAVANPSDLQLPPIDVDGEVDSLLDTWRTLLDDGNLRLVLLSGRTPLSAETTARLGALESCCRRVEGPTTLDTLARELQQANGLHLIAHGNLRNDQALLWLEKADGCAALIEEQELSIKFKLPRLRFVFLHSCKGSAGTVGLGPRFVEFGVPAVVAMQDFVPMADARRFASAFYTALVQEGAVDIAANAGRQAIFRARSANWSIPVLFCRLKDAKVWKAEPVRAAVQKMGRRYQTRTAVTQPFPLDVVLIRGGLADVQPTADDLAGPRLDLMEGSRKALEPTTQTPAAYVVLLGSRGRAKSSHLQRLFVEAARGQPGPPEPLPTPLLLYLADCVPELGTAAATIAWAVAATFRRENVVIEGLDETKIEAALSTRAYLLLVDGDDDIGGPARADAIGVLARFQSESAQAHRVLLSADSQTFDKDAPHPPGMVALILQDMAPHRVSAYLKEHCPELEQDLQSTRLFDLAAVPWLLGRLMDTARQKTKVTSRAEVLGRFAREALARLEGSVGARSRAEQVLSRMAWQMQNSREPSLSDAEAYKILADVRGNLDFQLQQFLEAILKQSKLLVWSGTEGVCFAYRGLQWHYCAKYLNALPPRELEKHLEDITATLGRLSRAHLWDVTLVVLAGLTDKPDALIRQILAGSALTEGEQVFIAARCVHEARGAQRSRGVEKGTRIEPSIVDQIVDTLVWRSRPDNARSTATRQKAIKTLALLEDERVIPYLVSLATQRVRRNWEGMPAFDYSGVRLAAVQTLFGMHKPTLDYLAKQDANGPMQRLLDAWLQLDAGKVGQQLDAHDASMSAVAAFALGTLPADAGTPHLLGAFLDHAPASTSDDVVWAITDALALIDPVRITKEVVLPLLEHKPWATYLAYLIGRLGVATPDGLEFEFLRHCLATGDDALAGRALRSYAALLGLQGSSAPQADLDQVRELCHQLVANQFDATTAGSFKSAAAAGGGRRHLRYQAFEALRSIGNAQSIEELRKVRQRPYDAAVDEASHTARSSADTATHGFDSLSFEIAEEIYWRLGGGLRAESYLPRHPT